MGAFLDKLITILVKVKDILMKGVTVITDLIPFINKEKENFRGK